MNTRVLLRGVLATAIAAVILFWGVGFLANTDPIWFLRTFHPGVTSVKLYWDDGVYTLNPGDAGFEELSAAFVDGVAHWHGYEGNVVLSEANLLDYRQRGRLMQVYYDTPVQVHSRYSYPKSKMFIIPLNRSHAYYRRVYSMPEWVEWAVSAISMDENRFAVMVSAAETAVNLASPQLADAEGVAISETSDEAAAPPGPTPTATSLAENTPVLLPSAKDTSDITGLAFAEFLEVSYTKLGLRYPEYMTELGIADVLGIGNDKLDDLSDAYIRDTQQLEREIYANLLTYNRQDLSVSEQRSFDVYKWWLEDSIEAQAYMYNDYPLNQFILSVHNSTIHFFTEIHPVTDYRDAEDYITRLSQVDDKFLAVLDGLKLREERGVILPRFLIQWTLSDLNSMANADARYTPYYQTFSDKVNALDSLTDIDKKALVDAAEDMIIDAVLPAYQELADYYTNLQSVATNDAGVWKFADGEKYYAYMLKHFTTTDLTAAEINQLGLQEVERIEKEMREIFADLGYPQDESIPVLYERVGQDSGYLSGNDILRGYESLIEEANARARESFDLLPSSDVVVIEDEIGGYYVAPAVDGSRPGAFYASASGNEPKFAMPTLAYHEAVPGHHFQIAIAQELDLPSFRKESQFTAYTEGWALYAEYLAWELGLYDDDPYGNLGRLQAEMFRAVRLVVDTAIHSKGWTYDQAVAYMVEHTGQPERMVQYQIARYIVWPGQAVSYKIGMMKIMELRQRAQDALGDAFDIREFHNVILREGAVPLAILEQIVDEYIETEL